MTAPLPCESCGIVVYQWPDVEALMWESIEEYKAIVPISLPHERVDMAIAAVIERHRQDEAK